MIQDPEDKRGSSGTDRTDARHAHTVEEGAEFKVEDRRHWLRDEGVEDAADPGATDAAPQQPTVIDEYRGRAEAAERRLMEYIEAFKAHEREQDAFRERLSRDIERRTTLRFAEMVSELLQTAEDLELALSHADAIPEARPVAEGLALARDRFLAALGRQGIQVIVPQGAPFDPHESEALRVDPVDSPEQDGLVTETLQSGYRLGDHVIRPARVAVGRHTPKA